MCACEPGFVYALPSGYVGAEGEPAEPKAKP